MDKNNKT